MSSDIENNKEDKEEKKEVVSEDEDEEEEEPKKSLKRRIAEKWNVGMKILEIVLAIACLCFIYDPIKLTGLGKSHLHHVGIAYTAYTGYILINCTLLLGRFMGDRLPYKTSTVFSICGASMFLVTGILLVSDRSHLTKHYFFHPTAYLMEMLTTSTIFAFVNVLVFVVDAALTFKRQEDL